MLVLVSFFRCSLCALLGLATLVNVKTTLLISSRQTGAVSGSTHNVLGGARPRVCSLMRSCIIKWSRLANFRRRVPGNDSMLMQSDVACTVYAGVLCVACAVCVCVFVFCVQRFL